MRCTVKKTFAVAAEADIALIVQLKDNQPTLHRQSREISATTTPLGPAHSHDTGRNRDERRTVAVFDPADTLADADWHGHIAAVIRVEREVFTRSAATGLLHHCTETASYVANTPLPATRAADAIRAHWTIETTSHYSRDVTLGEDRSRIRTNPGVVARLRSFAFNTRKANHTNTLSQDRYRAALAGIDNLLTLITSPER
jgi:predicted transposase YbfD/YdcC